MELIIRRMGVLLPGVVTGGRVPFILERRRNVRQTQLAPSLVELKRARASLESCGQAQASETALAACVPSAQAS
jgi:hypothetical protein